MSFDEKIISKGKYLSIFSCQMEAYFLIDLVGRPDGKIFGLRPGRTEREQNIFPSGPT